MAASPSYDRGAARVAGAPINPVELIAASEFMLSIVESHWDGAGTKMETADKAQKELETIERQIAQVEATPGQNQDTHKQLQDLHARVDALRREMSAQVEAWEKTELARHPQRPHTLDYIERVFTDWSEIHGDRGFADDHAIVCGMARFHGEEVLVLGTQKERDMKLKIYRNFGLPNPEGYRKTLRAMKIAEKFGRPVITLVDVTGANPGLGAEERGQAEAIARNLREMARLKVPIISVITGEGGSGGALAIAIGDRVLMLENAIYSVISPEGCASIMWRDATKKALAAQALRITAPDLIELKLIDEVVPEPEGGAHLDHEGAAALLDAALSKTLAELKKLPISELLASRYNKFRNIAQYYRGE
jgi:acetyl-CoA carboxylase carboxyl transferase subunit alpha